MSELELKFQVPAEIVPSLRAELQRRRARTVPMVALYFDTPDFTLGRHRVSLRLRREGDQWVQTLKATGRSAVDRLEHSVALRDRATPELDIRRHAGS